MNILDLITPQSIVVPLDAADKQTAIDSLIDHLASKHIIDDPQEIKRVVWEREEQRSTGIGEGLAIPHGKTKTIDKLIMAIARPAQPIDFQSIDDEPVSLIVLLISPPDKTADHIQALGKISRLMADSQVRRSIYNALTPDELYGLLEQAVTV